MVARLRPNHEAIALTATDRVQLRPDAVAGSQRDRLVVRPEPGNPLEITQREGGGTWGGRVLQAYVDGYYPSGSPAHIAMSISTMQSLFGGGRSNWFDLAPAAPPTIPPPAWQSLGSTATGLQGFWVSAVGHLMEQRWVSGTRYGAALDLGAPPGGDLSWDPGTASSGGGHVDVAVRDVEGRSSPELTSAGSGWTVWRPRM